jgi:hypothetical protein
MDASSTNGELILWDVPFAEWKGISAWVIKEGIEEGYTVVVAPTSEKRPQDNYPKYLVRFEKVITLLQYEEACATHRLYRDMSGSTRGVRAYCWNGSPWLEGYKKCVFWDANELHHYVILGDDNFIEVISVGEPKIERVESKQFIEVKHEV